IGTSNLQASRAVAQARPSVAFQCLNRHEQPSSGQGYQTLEADRQVSMPQSARATFKPGNPDLEGIVRKFQCLNRHEQPSSFNPRYGGCAEKQFQCLNRPEQPSTASRSGWEVPGQGFNASIGTSNLQARSARLSRQTGKE